MKNDDTTNLSRRQILKGGAALAGAAAGTAITGFPAVIAAEPVTLRYLSTAVNQSPAIAERAAKDLGIKIEYVTVTTDDVTKRIITQPNTFDIDRPNLNRSRLPFGWGTHFCLGAALSRAAMTVAVEAFTRRLTDVALAGDVQLSPARGMLRGPERLPIVFTPRPA